MDTATPPLDIEHLTKRYGEITALRGVDLRCARGEVVGLIGRNGAGKTTLVSIVAGLRRPDGGRVRVVGTDVSLHPHRARALLGLAPQEIGIYPTLSVRQNLRYFGELAGVQGRALRTRMDELLDALHLTELADRVAGGLSGGQQRRLHTAMAMVHRPPLLLLDEPTAGADIQTRIRLLEVIKGLAAAGSGIVYSTHVLKEVEDLGASVAILHEGGILARGTLQDVVAAHGRAWVQLTFHGPAPEQPPAGVERDGNVLRHYSEDPPGTVPGLLAQLGEAVDRLRSVELFPASLESTYLALTGTGAPPTGTAEERDVLASA